MKSKKNNQNDTIKILKHSKKNPIRDNIKNFTNSSQSQILEMFEVEQFGLSEEQILIQKEKYGLNNLKQKKFNYFFSFLKSFLTPFNLILMVIVAFNFYQ